jgi:hypothetical protein
MAIDINQLTEAELIDLNRRIVQRLRFLQQMRTDLAMLDFTVGERVAFHPDRYTTVEGTLTKYNKKTVTVITDDGHRWNVSPRLLVRVGGKAEQSSRDPKAPRLPP